MSNIVISHVVYCRIIQEPRHYFFNPFHYKYTNGIIKVERIKNTCSYLFDEGGANKSLIELFENKNHISSCSLKCGSNTSDIHPIKLTFIIIQNNCN